MRNINGEWCVFYHGLGNIKEKITGIISEGTKDDILNAYSHILDLKKS